MIANSLIAAAAISTAVGAAPAKAVSQKPNILTIIVDQLSADVMSNRGCKWVNTPALDKLADRGVSFSKANCSAPLCTPSRAAMFTGYYPEKVYGHVMDYPCLGTLVHNAGYSTAYMGKWHVGKTEIEDNPAVQKWSGFDHYYQGYDAATEKNAIEYLQRKAETKQKSPFFLVVSFVNPHDCCELARKIGGWQDKFTQCNKGGVIPDLSVPIDKLPPLPDNFAPTDKIPEALAALTPPKGKNWVSLRPTGAWGKTEWRRYLYGYAQLVESVDARIGRIMDSLEKSGLDSNTVVIFTSDHGDGIAAHQWNQKHSFYEESVKIPLIIVDPRGERNKHSKILVNTGIDFLPTILDYAGGSYQGYPGISLKPWVEGIKTDKESSREMIVAQFYRNAQGLGLAQAPQCPERNRMAAYREARSRMLRTQDYKYIVYDSGRDPEMLFDLKNDPGELHNLAYDPKCAKIVQNFRKLLRKHLKTTEDTFIPPEYSKN